MHEENDVPKMGGGGKSLDFLYSDIIT